MGEKLIEKSLGHKGGYEDSIGTPTSYLASEIQFADSSIGDMVDALKRNGIYEQTLIIISAKHGQSPVDSARYLGISSSPNDPITTSPATILDNAGCIPYSEAPSNPTGIGPTEDDVSLVWLKSSCNTQEAVNLLRSTSPTTNNVAGIGEIFSGPIFRTYFNAPGLPPTGDPRTPDIGVTYSGSTKKLAEHRGFSRDDTNVIMLVSNPCLSKKTVTSTVDRADRSYDPQGTGTRSQRAGCGPGGRHTGTSGLAVLQLILSSTNNGRLLRDARLLF